MFKCASSSVVFCLIFASEVDVVGPFLKSDVHRSTVRSDKARVFPNVLVSSLLKKNSDAFKIWLKKKGLKAQVYLSGLFYHVTKNEKEEKPFISKNEYILNEEDIVSNFLIE